MMGFGTRYFSQSDWKLRERQAKGSILKSHSHIQLTLSIKKQFNGDQGSVTCGEYQIVNTYGEWKYGLPLASKHNR